MKLSWLLSVILLAACATNVQHRQLTDIPVAAKPDIPKTEADCLAAGQFWTAQGLPGGGKSCAVRTNDRHKICTDSSQCQGSCVVADSVPIGAKAIGSCSEWVANFGCFRLIKDGQVSELCAD